MAHNEAIAHLSFCLLTKTKLYCFFFFFNQERCFLTDVPLGFYQLILNVLYSRSLLFQYKRHSLDLRRGLEMPALRCIFIHVLFYVIVHI